MHAELADAVGVAPEDIFQGDNGLPLDIDERGARFVVRLPASHLDDDGQHHGPPLEAVVD